MTKRTSWILLFAAALAGCGPSTPDPNLCVGRKPGDLVITEFLNDPSSTDTGNEWIEIYNSLGTSIDLKGITVYVKKSDGTGLKSHLIRAGTVQARSYFALGDIRSGPLPAHIGYSYAADLGSLSNTDGIIGFKCKDTVLHEVKYSVTPKAGHARQLDGKVTPDAAANTEADFCDAPVLFQGTDYGSPGQANPPCQVTPGGGNCDDNGVSRPIISPAPGDVVITEVMANPKAVSDTVGEWVEVLANVPVDLNGLTLTSGSSKSTFNDPACIRMAAGEYGLLAKSADAGLPNVRATFSLSLVNTAGPVALWLSDAGIDTAGLPAALDGISWQLDPTKNDATMNDDPLSFCRATARYGDPDAGDFGTPALANTACGAMPGGDQCMDVGGAMRPIVAPVVGDLVISEVMADPLKVADAVGEWFEVVVKNPVDLNGLVLASGSTTTSSTLTSVACLAQDAGTHLVFAHSADPAVNGALPVVNGLFTFGLTNSGGTILLKSGDGGVLDTMSFGATTPGASTQLDGTKYDVVLNDDLANYCLTDAGVVWATFLDGGVSDRGSPGTQNKACP